MIRMVRRFIDSYRGFGDFSLTVPSLDGPYKPNDAIEEAALIAKTPEPPANLASMGGTVHFSCGGTVLKLVDGVALPVSKAGALVTAMAGSPSGELLIARSGGNVVRMFPDGREVTFKPLPVRGDITALAVLSDGRVAAAVGAEGRTSEEWRQDLMERGQSGSLWIIDVADAKKLAGGLGYPCGVTETPRGELIVSLAWETALVAIDASGRRRTVLANLPGYPSRIVPAADGGWWLSVFAPRNQLVEFVMRERAFRQRMMAGTQPDYWICPQMKPGDDPLSPMQQGAQKIAGAIKPWAPSLSYGLVIRIGGNFVPQRSHHSRANGCRHGITSVLEHSGRLFMTSAGSHSVLSI